MSRRIAACVIVLGPLLKLLSPGAAWGAPSVVSPALAVSKEGSAFLTLSLTGSGFGAPGPNSSAIISGKVGGRNTTLPAVLSTNTSVVVWSNVHVVVNVRPDLTNAKIKVKTPSVPVRRSRRITTPTIGSTPRQR